MALRESLLADFDHEMGTTRRLLERVPDDRLSWKPHAKSMTMGALAIHLCSIPRWGVTIMNDPFFDLLASAPNEGNAVSCAGILTSFDATVQRARGAMDKTDAELHSLWSLRRGEQEMFTLPRIAAFRSFILHHIIHHRGQLSVYLRLNDIPVPSIYGPSADEG
jgi:uncharacterized damage-inducible protein DinB